MYIICPLLYQLSYTVIAEDLRFLKYIQFDVALISYPELRQNLVKIGFGRYLLVTLGNVYGEFMVWNPLSKRNKVISANVKPMDSKS